MRIAVVVDVVVVDARNSTTTTRSKITSCSMAAHMGLQSQNLSELVWEAMIKIQTSPSVEYKHVSKDNMYLLAAQNMSQD